MGRRTAGRALILAALAACSTGSTSTTVSAGGQTAVIPCPGSGCVGDYLFTCDSDGNSAPAGTCGLDAGAVDAATDAD